MGGQPGWAAITNHGRLIWAIDADTRIAMSMRATRVISHKQSGLTHELTERNPDFVDADNPRGETDAVLQFKSEAVSDALALAIEGGASERLFDSP